MTTSVRSWIEDFIVQLQRHTTEIEQLIEQMEAEIRPDFKEMNATESKASQEKTEVIT
jgi:hypothetical protein